ncbi:hypothetical protein HOLleu_17417 [Holothuria leucospilota]|uniref:Uncharacterized protein n=1 Tax=Holothuria leucospilota TaxID=206669 RepID=A0A9Q1H918_HOLLE|nr:hypothetical protein HOLleu_17417 [Holothuria leucospilota]
MEHDLLSKRSATTGWRGAYKKIFGSPKALRWLEIASPGRLTCAENISKLAFRVLTFCIMTHI